jgi:hypothetical protein
MAGMNAPDASIETASGEAIRRRRRRAGVKLILAYWAVLYVLFTTRFAFAGIAPDQQLIGAATRIVTVAAAMLMCFGIWLILERLARRPVWQRASVAGILTLPAAALFALIMLVAFRATLRDTAMHDLVAVVPQAWGADTWRYVAVDSFEWWPLFMAWAALAFGLFYSFDVENREQRIAHLQALAHETQLRALQYQVNPHFLFNTFNVISSLILDKETELAEEMVLNLSHFFREMLTIDPAADVTLERELELQRLYLDIERVRFPERLHVDVDVPADLMSAQVPSLILQPLIENAVKYGVAPSQGRTTLAITASRDDGLLFLEVRDDGHPGPRRRPAASTGTGLQNVRSRLETRFGSRHRFDAGPRPEGGFRVRIGLPLEPAG